MCHDALSPGGSVVCNFFNGPAGSPRRAALTQSVRLFSACIGPVHTFCVPGQEESLVLCARRPATAGTEADAGAAPSRCELSAGARAAWGGTASLRPREAARLTRRVFRAEAVPDKSGAADAPPRLLELIPPKRSGSLNQARLIEGSSACAASMEYEADDASC